NFFFFFSSRRRHTRWPRDWSSDVCSSDLLAGKVVGQHARRVAGLQRRRRRLPDLHLGDERRGVGDRDQLLARTGEVALELKLIRSEERRVGKECRARWWRERWKIRQRRHA